MGRRPMARDIFLSIFACLIILVPSALALYWIDIDMNIFREFKDFLTGKEIITGTVASKGNIGALLVFFCVGLLVCMVIGKFNHLFFGVSTTKDWEYGESPLLFVAIHYLLFAFLEEFIFRFGLINIFKIFFVSWYGPVIISSILFGLIHIPNYGDRLVLRVVPQVIAGFLLAFVFLKYGFWTAVIFHALYNISAIFIDRIYRLLFPNSHERYMVAFEQSALRK